MKNLWMSTFTFALLLSFGAVLTSCENEEPEEPQTTSISDEEIIEIVSAATASSTEGVTAEAIEMAYVADAVLEKGPSPLECGETADSTFVRDINLDRISGSYSNYLFWGLNCSGVLPTSIFYGREMNGNYETDRWLSDDSADSDWLIEDLLTGPNYVFNGQYERSGTQESKVREMRSFSTTTLIEVQDLNIDKGQKEIESGLANFTLNGTVNGETTFEHTGTIVFLGGGAANLIINGNTYTIDLY